MRDNVIKVALISQSSKINHTVEDYLEQTNNNSNVKYTLNWFDDFETWINQSHNSQYNIYLIDEYVLLPITKEIIIHIQHTNNFAPIIILTRSEANGQHLLDFGISDYLNLEILDSTALEHSLKLTIARDYNQKIAHQNNDDNKNKLKSSETLYEDFFTYSTDGLFSLSVINNNTLIYDTINAAYEQIIGVSKATIIGKNIKEILPALEERKYRYCIDSKESLSYEHSRKIKGITHTWLTILVPIENEEGTVIKIHGSTRDITQQKKRDRTTNKTDSVS